MFTITEHQYYEAVKFLSENDIDIMAPAYELDEVSKNYISQMVEYHAERINPEKRKEIIDGLDSENYHERIQSKIEFMKQFRHTMIKMEQDIVSYTLDKMEQEGMVKSYIDTNGEFVYEITEKGAQALHDFKEKDEH